MNIAVWLGEPFRENCLDLLDFQGPRLPCSCFEEHVPKIGLALNVLDSKDLLDMDRVVHIWIVFQKSSLAAVWSCKLWFQRCARFAKWHFFSMKAARGIVSLIITDTQDQEEIFTFLCMHP